MAIFVQSPTQFSASGQFVSLAETDTIRINYGTTPVPTDAAAVFANKILIGTALQIAVNGTIYSASTVNKPTEVAALFAAFDAVKLPGIPTLNGKVETLRTDITGGDITAETYKTILAISNALEILNGTALVDGSVLKSINDALGSWPTYTAGTNSFGSDGSGILQAVADKLDASIAQLNADITGGNISAETYKTILAISNALEVLNADASTAGSVAKSIADYLGSWPTYTAGTNSFGSDGSGILQAVADKLDASIAQLNADITGGNISAETYKTILAISNALEVLNADASTAGSVAKSIADAIGTKSVADDPNTQESEAKAATGLWAQIEALFDTTAPTITDVTLSATGAQNSTLNAGDVVSVTVAFSEPVVVKGLPTIALTVDNDTKQATYVSGGGSNQLVFSYTVETNSVDTDGISVAASAISLADSAQIVDTWGNAATLMHAAMADQASMKVDAVVPTAAAAPLIAEAADKLNATEASDGTVVTVGITGTDAVKGNILTLNWGGQAVNYALLQADIDASSATVNVSSQTIATQGDGSVAVSAFITDAAGNIGATSQATTITVDTAPPKAPAAPVVTEATLGGINANEAANGTEVVVNITATGAVAGDTLTIGWGNTSVTHTLTASDITNNSATVTVDQGAITAKNGTSFNVTAQLTAAAGNVGAVSVATSVNVDTSKPTASVATFAIENTGNASVQSTEAGMAYLVHRYVMVNSLSDITGADTNLWNSVAISAGGTATPLPAAGLIGGVYDVYTVDAAGNLSAAAAGGGVTVSTTTSTVSLAFSGLEDTGTNDLPPVTRDKVFTLKATGQAAGSTLVYEKSMDGGANWTTTTDSQSGLTEGTYLFRAKVTDTSFNTVVTNVLEMTVDTTAPTAPTSLVIKDANGATISSASATKQTALTLEITSEPNAQVAVYDGINFLGWAEETATSGTYQYAVSGLKDGAYAFNAKATDAAGNAGALSTAANVTVDTVAPTIVISPVADRDAFYTVAFDQGFSVPEGAVVVASVNGSDVTSQFTDTTLNGITTYTAKAGAFTGSETIKVNATLADAAGNVGTATEVTLGQIDSTAPALTSASINGKTLVLQYSDAGNLDPLTSPLLSNYTVKVGGQAVGATQAVYDASAKTVTLTLKDSVASTAVVTVDYTPSTVRPLQDTAGNDALTLSGAAVTNATPADAIAPSFVSATVDGKTLILDYDEALSTTFPNAQAFTVQVNGTTPAGVSNIRLKPDDASKLELTLDHTVAGGDVVTVAYTAPTHPDATTSNAAIQDLLGNDAATLAAQNVSNLVADTTKPTATITGADYFERNDTIGANGVVHTLRLTGTDFTTLLSGGESEPPRELRRLQLLRR